jgi:hypothetical protein
MPLSFPRLCRYTTGYAEGRHRDRKLMEILVCSAHLEPQFQEWSVWALGKCTTNDTIMALPLRRFARQRKNAYIKSSKK